MTHTPDEQRTTHNEMMTHTTRDRLLVCLIVATVAIAPLTAGVAAGTSTTTTEQTDMIGELTLEVTEETDETVTVALSTDVEDVAGYQAHLEFDPDATAVQSVSGGSGEYEAEPVTNVDNGNGTVQFNQIAESAPGEGEDAPTMATLTFETPDSSTDVSFVDDDSLVATSEPEDVTDLLRTGVTIGAPDGSGDDPGDGGDGPGDDPGDGNDGAPGGGGGGGGGGGDDGTSDDDPIDTSSEISADVTASDNGVTMSASDVSAGDTVEATFEDFSDDHTTVSGVSLSMSTDADEVGLDTELLGGQPADTEDLSGSAPLSYVEFTPDGFESADLESASVSFEVGADSLPDEASPDDVLLHRYVDGDWEALETNHEGDGTYVAETPGFSTFAVGSAQADVFVTEASLSSDVVHIGDEITVEATVENAGNADGEATVSLLVDEETTDEQAVSVSANDDATTTFSFASDDAGDYTLSVDDVDAGSLSVSDDGADEGTTDGDGTDDGVADGGADDAATTESADGVLEQFGGSLPALVGLVALVAIAVAGVAIWRQ